MDAPASAPASTVLIGDLNGDGRADVIYARRSGGDAALFPYLSNGLGGFAPRPAFALGEGRSPESDGLSRLATADVDGDGASDVVHLRTIAGKLVLIPYLSDGNGGFTAGAPYATGVDLKDAADARFDVATTDMTADGRDDLVHGRSDAGRLAVTVHVARPVPMAPDADGDGLSDAEEQRRGTDAHRDDSDGDGVLDGADLFPLDPTRSDSRGDPADTTPPTITLLEPSNAIPLP